MTVRNIDDIKKILNASLYPAFLNVIDESDKHSGHSGYSGDGTVSHIRIEVVSSAFEGMTVMQMHRMIYQLLEEEINTGLHAIAIKARATL